MAKSAEQKAADAAAKAEKAEEKQGKAPKYATDHAARTGRTDETPMSTNR